MRNYLCTSCENNVGNRCAAEVDYFPTRNICTFYDEGTKHNAKVKELTKKIITRKVNKKDVNLILWAKIYD